jgi:hypothetical protein
MTLADLQAHLEAHPTTAAQPLTEALAQRLGGQTLAGYTLLPLAFRGDVADVHAAQSCEGVPVWLKLPREPGAATFLAHEREALAEIHDGLVGTAFAKLLPWSHRTIEHEGQSVSVLSRDPKAFGLAQIRAEHPELELAGRHGVWLLDRLFAALWACHQRGWVHGAVFDQHLALRPADHGLTLFGFGQAARTGYKLTRGVAERWADYPPEALHREPVGPQTDLWLTAKTALGWGSWPEPLAIVLGRCLDPATRPTDAWAVRDAWRKAAEMVYGPPSYTPLDL